MLLFVVVWAIGILVGSVITLICMTPKSDGILRIDTSSDEPYEPYLFLELKDGIGPLMNKTQVVMTVKRENISSQK